MSSSSTSTTCSMIRVCASATFEICAGSPEGEKKQSATLAPPATGRLMGRHSFPKVSTIRVMTRSRSRSALSILFTTIMRDRPRSPAACMMVRVFISTPARASMTTATDSTALRAGSVRPMKSG